MATGLQAQDIDNFLPVYRTRHRWSDRTKELTAPLFPGYVFAQFRPSNLPAVLKTRGAIRVVGFGSDLARIDDEEISNLRALAASGVPRAPWPFLKEGQTVEIVDGPLRGIRGILVQAGGEDRVVVSITLLQRSVAVAVDASWIQKAA